MTLCAFFDRIFSFHLVLSQVTSGTDTSNFDPYGVDDHVDDGYVDHGNWDKDF